MWVVVVVVVVVVGGLLHTPSVAFRHFLQRKDVVNQCSEFGVVGVCL